jgi:hypothetical protein
MRSLLLVAAPILTAALLSSCGNPPVANTFSGDYTGTFTASVSSFNGTLALSVKSDGAVSGTIVLTSSSEATKPTTSVSGTIQNDGTLNATYKYSGDAFPLTTLSGKVTLTDKTVTGTLNVSTAAELNAEKLKINLTKK